MSNEGTITATLWLMIILQTIGNVDLPGYGPRKMPAPRSYVAIVVAWSIFGLMAETGARRMAAHLAVLTTLAGAVLGPFGQRAITLLNTVANNFGTPPPAQQAGGSTTLQLQPTPGTHTYTL